jgi:hypothetical protein
MDCDSEQKKSCPCLESNPDSFKKIWLTIILPPTTYTSTSLGMKPGHQPRGKEPLKVWTPVVCNVCNRQPMPNITFRRIYDDGKDMNTFKNPKFTTKTNNNFDETMYI